MVNSFQWWNRARRSAAVGLIALASVAVQSMAAAERPSIQVCARINPPFMFVDDSGTLRGLEHDLLRAFATYQGAELEIIWSESFAKVFTMLQARACDLGAATITKTAEREMLVDFSAPYFPVRILLVERSSSPVTVSTESLAGRLAATIAESTYEQALRQIDGIRLKQVDNSLAMFETVAAGEADLLACDSAIVLALIEGFPSLRISIPLSERDELAFALSKGSVWRQPLNDFLSHVRQNGDLRDLLTRYFGEQGADLILDREPADTAPDR